MDDQLHGQFARLVIGQVFPRNRGFICEPTRLGLYGLVETRFVKVMDEMGLADSQDIGDSGSVVLDAVGEQSRRGRGEPCRVTVSVSRMVVQFLYALRGMQAIDPRVALRDDFGIGVEHRLRSAAALFRCGDRR